uniref:Uncharacterized protein n=1 Tax=Helianthus annuus TaxID=4232 RepID=A0A251UHN3_HELAN
MVQSSYFSPLYAYLNYLKHMVRVLITQIYALSMPPLCNRSPPYNSIYNTNDISFS